MVAFLPLIELEYQADSFKNWDRYVASGIVSPTDKALWLAESREIDLGGWTFQDAIRKRHLEAMENQAARDWLALHGDGKTSLEEAKRKMKEPLHKESFQSRRAKRFLVSGLVKSLRRTKK